MSPFEKCNLEISSDLKRKFLYLSKRDLIDGKEDTMNSKDTLSRANTNSGFQGFHISSQRTNQFVPLIQPKPVNILNKNASCKTGINPDDSDHFKEDEPNEEINFASSDRDNSRENLERRRDSLQGRLPPISANRSLNKNAMNLTRNSSDRSLQKKAFSAQKNDEVEQMIKTIGFPGEFHSEV